MRPSSKKKFTSRVWHRDFDDAEIVACPDDSVVGKSIGQVARERKLHPVDAFLDLVVEHGQSLRWRTTIANALDVAQLGRFFHRAEHRLREFRRVARRRKMK